MSEKVCVTCCQWAHGSSDPRVLADTYPAMMRTVLEEEFNMPCIASDYFIAEACAGNWKRMHLTDAETRYRAKTWAETLRWDVRYCSDRWSWDRVIRCQWAYMRLRDALGATDG